MEKTGFIYLWYDIRRKMYYLGCHLGTEDDGYICSSNRMRDAYRRRPQDFRRRIIQKNIPKGKLLEEEYRWLSLIADDELGRRYYNIQKHHFGHWSTIENKKTSVSEKIRQHHATEDFKKLARECKLGDKNPMKRPEVVQKRLESYLKNNHTPWNKGKSGTYSTTKKGKKYGPLNEETRNKIRASLKTKYVCANKIAVTIDGTVYESKAAARRSLGLTNRQINRIVKR